jgi:cell filamentation protein
MRVEKQAWKTLENKWTKSFMDNREAILIARRLVELRAHPLDGNFDITHLKETHRYIFQDLPQAGLWAYSVPPGAFRPATQTWCKERTLASIVEKGGKTDFSFTSYSLMDSKAIERLSGILREAKPENLRGLRRDVFVEKISGIYSDLDYTHPFREGNSRTLRTFTDQLAREAGYELNWEKFSGERNRDLLYIARDRGLAERASRDEDHSPVSLAKALHDMERHQGYPSLAQLLDKTVEQTLTAPRHDLDKNQAQMHVAATENVAANLEALKKNPALADKSAEALEKLAFWRGIVQEDVKREPQAAQDVALAKFDKAAENPEFLQRLEKSDNPAQEQTTQERETHQRKDTQEQSL